jgi:hypothetical protein
MEKIMSRQWMAMPAVCAQVPELSPPAVTAEAHRTVGYGAAAAGIASGAALVQLAPPVVRVQGITVFAVTTSVNGQDPVGGVRGIPPRGWPV